ncbi:scavenger receptor cysteine-rich type 1 protein M130-like [Scleropages formosus]|uniref:scavenger receptor cysteine-rich type 1 protein M130-like n=1 Tax=Scleropages formosus TaxID=113540 RepID=UPI0010FAC73D|nr:scavenger receptor cysteine-rich type 1 protein M130-like [Scleropages formosus]
MKAGYTGVRLLDSLDRCSGRVELKYNGKWGTVCDASWDIRASTVLCHQLKCGHAVGQAWFGEGHEPIWADVFQCHGNETRLSQCAVSPWSRAACSHGQDVGVICSGSSPSLSVGGVRLLSGGSDCEGWVEVFYNQTWWRIHKKSWSFTDSSVVCRQLGCGSAAKVRPSGAGEGDRCVTGFQCSGTEAHLGTCSSPQILTCKPRDQVFIICTNHRSLRLVGGGADCAGRLEVFHGGSWGTVCDDFWGPAEAQVACRQLRCGTALSGQNPVPAYFGPGSGPIWLGRLGCTGSESSLWDCPSAWFGQQDCGHREDVGVVCSEHKLLRLSEGCFGHTEVYYNGSWGSVCFNFMEKTTAAVICRQLGCGDKGTVDETISRLSPEAIRDDVVKCHPHDSLLWQCPFSLSGWNTCTDSKMAKIYCSEVNKFNVPFDFTDCESSTDPQNSCSSHLPVRLMEGTDPCSGRVEVYHKGSWGTICDNFWDLQDAEVVCRQLGCGPALKAEKSAKFKRGDGAIWLDEVNCRGSELYLWHCSFSVQQSSCSHKQDAGVTCAGRTVTASDISGPPKAKNQPKTKQSPPALSFVVFGSLISVLLLLITGLIYKNTKMRKELATREENQLHPAIYEEINYSFNRYAIQESENVANFLDELPSDYEDVEEIEGDNLLDRRNNEGNPEHHGNVSNSKKNLGTQSDTLEYYNDSTAHQTLEYDDVTVDQTVDYNNVAAGHGLKFQFDCHPSNPMGHQATVTSLTCDQRFAEVDSIDYDDVRNTI